LLGPAVLAIARTSRGRRHAAPPDDLQGLRAGIAVTEYGPRRVIAHMDCDAFYASVELMRRPQLRGRPLIVAGSGLRAVVTTASYEARRFGVASAMSAAYARRLCPQAVFVAPDFEAYRAKSREVWQLVGSRLRRPLQQASLDEAYAELSELDRPLARLRSLVAEVREQTGITISVGVGPSRLVAKTASDCEKPAGFVVLSREQACERFSSAPARLLRGSGRRPPHGCVTWASSRSASYSEPRRLPSPSASQSARPASSRPELSSTTTHRSRPLASPSRGRTRPPSIPTSPT
jgi:hypothetical protein